MTIGFGHGISVTPLHVVDRRRGAGQWRHPAPADHAVRSRPGAEREGMRVISERTSETMRR